MAKIEINAVLGNSGFFSSVSDELIDRIGRMARVEEYDRGDLIFADETPCTGMYVVGEGAVKIYKIGPDGREHVLHVAEPGETFGEAAMFIGSIGYPAYAGAVKKSQVVFIPKRPMLELLEREPHLTFQVLGSLAMWTHRLVTKLELLTLKDASSRLAGYIADRASETGKSRLTLSIPKQTLAAQLAITSETLSRLLNRFEAQGIIRSEGKNITVLDPEALREVSDWGAGV
ncbi:MAG: Crp/Fnr family transcriptional regulator [Armatimonadota bacterium]